MSNKSVDPIDFAKIMWPDVVFANYQKDIIYSVEENNETFCVSANEMGV